MKYVIVLMVLLSSVVLYNFYKINESHAIHSSVQQEIERNDYVDFSALVEGDWDTIILVTPYTSKAELKEKYGIAVNRISNFSIEYLDDRMLVVFCQGKRIQDYMYWTGRLSLSKGEQLYETTRIKREDAQFKIDETHPASMPLNLIQVN
ncbi:hypothetical protein [Sporosarcina aquimarina]|uniref:DUF4362 domain-containing protein n=1 Tax=Sporosarcina aquimarina TaxID=114975 RepID=A0ABU4G1U5_9BACL|nr:hypothetical protein [Sporosarcina aquimarina]MDW0110938.1 hypothetical protein [Sporosarcina aquimarina]